MKVQMKAQISGTRNGVRWPAPGETLTVPDDEGRQLCEQGYAEPVAAPAQPEKRTTGKGKA